jgi:hypothetical protein
MGSLTNMIRQVTGANEEEQRAKERMQLLLVAAKAKIESFRNQLDEAFTNPALIEKTQIPGIRAIRYIEQYHVASKNGFSDQVSGHLEAAIDSFFSIGEGKDKKAVQNGIKALIQTGLSAFIGSTEAGETMDKMYFVVPENNAFIRADVMCWKYNLTQNKLLAQNDTAVAYVLCKSVIDHTAIKLDELIYLVTQALSSGLFATEKAAIDIDKETQPKSDEDWKAILKRYKLCSDNEADVVVTKLLNSDKKEICVKESQIDPLKKISESKYALTWEDVKRIVKCYGWFHIQQEDESTDQQKNDLIKCQSLVDALNNDGAATAEQKKAADTALKNAKRNITDANKYNLHPHYGIDTLTASAPMTPAKLSDVEAYIEEMIRVWKKLEQDR